MCCQNGRHVVAWGQVHAARKLGSADIERHRTTPLIQHRPPILDAALANECCHPSCDGKASDRIASQVPLCEVHIFDVYSATHRLLAIEKPKRDEYCLLPMEQQAMPGPCPSCGICGYLAVTVTDKVRCLNASCKYEAWVDEFEKLRRGLLFDLAAERNVVYYIKFRDRVKIGTSRNLKRRWTEIATVEMLYGFEFGGHRLERQRHSQFAPYRTVGEWFEDNMQIRAHINNVCATAA